MRSLVFLVLALFMGCIVPPRPESVPLSRHVDAVLGPRSNAMDGGVSLGSVGKHLQVLRLERRPGFSGSFLYLPSLRLEGALFRLEVGEYGVPVLFPPLTHQWWPSHVGMEGKADGLHLVERKLITEDDRAIDLVTLRNESADTRDLVLRISTDQERKGNWSLAAASFVEEGLIWKREIKLKPGQGVSFPIEMVFNGTPGRAFSPRFLSEYLKEYNGWFSEHIPDFDCPDPWFVKLWYYRWFLVRKSLPQNRANPEETRWLSREHQEPEGTPGEGTLKELWESRSGNLEESCRLFASAASDPKQAPLRDEIRSSILSRDLMAEKKISVFLLHAYGVIPVKDRRYDKLFDRLFDPAQFWAPFPARLEVGSPWTGMKENAVVLEALARAIRVYKVPSVTRRRFFDFLQRMVHAQFEEGDFRRPGVGGILESETGRWKTAQREAVETPYADLLIRYIGGLVPRRDRILELDPLVDHFSSFRFRRVPSGGALLDIIWDSPDGKDMYSDGIEGFTVRRNGTVLFTKPRLERVLWEN